VRVSPVDIDVIGIVVPARNEERRLPRCLAALEAATTGMRAADESAPRVRVIVVVDGSTDGTLEVAQQWPGVEVVHSAAGRVGAARRAGVDHLLRAEAEAGAARGLGRVWVANTDADSAVPDDWLSAQLLHARSGVELLLGTVRPDPQELAAGLLAAWRLRHLIADGHSHVHGANLGVRGDIYLAAGGFPDVATHEDVLLSAAVRRAGARVLSTGSNPVLTSGRTTGRAPGGMASYLRELRDVEISLEA
jgi:glycosyltransferase involved in cell wall biosynthesis